MPPDDDGDLMSRLRDGDDRALDALMDRWQAPLRRFIYRSTQNERDALELAEETFVRVYRNRDKFRPGAKFSTWLFAIAFNLCRDRARRGKAHPLVSLEEPDSVAAGEQSLRDSGQMPHDELLRAETALAVRAAVAALPEPLRTAVLLCEFEQLSLAEAGEVIGCSPKAVETRLYRARAILRNSLTAYV